MPRKSKGPRLYLDRERKQWAIRDGSSFVRTGCPESDNEGAEKQLAEYIARKYRPAAVASPVIADVLLIYALERLPKTRAANKAAHNISNLTPFWGKKRADDVNSDNCTAYANGRPPAAARRDLEVLRAALLYWNKHKAALSRIPAVVLPDKSEPRTRWLTQEEARRLRKAAMKHPHLDGERVMTNDNVWVLWIGAGHRIATCVEVPAAWLASYRRRVISEWRGRVLGVYRWKHSRP